MLLKNIADCAVRALLTVRDQFPDLRHLSVANLTNLILPFWFPDPLCTYFTNQGVASGRGS